MQTVRVALVGDRNDVAVSAHRAIPQALALAGATLGVAVASDWVATARLNVEGTALLNGAGGVWCVPGSPYECMEGALAGIRFARERRIPFLGTCGGFQHALIEYLRNAQGLVAADHAETAPGAAMAVIVPLACALIGAQGEIAFAEGSALRRAYAAPRATEEYNCSYGFNDAYRTLLADSALRFTAFTDAGEPRGFELPDHPFHVGTLFQPERSAFSGRAHPLVAAFVAAAAAHAARQAEEMAPAPG